MTEFIVSEVIDGEPLRLRKAEDGAQNLRLDRPILLWILLTLVKWLSPHCKVTSLLLLAKDTFLAMGHFVAAWFSGSLFMPSALPVPRESRKTEPRAHKEK